MPSRGFIVLYFCLNLSLMLPATSQTVGKDPVPTLNDFLADPSYWSPELSPSGMKLIGVRRVGESVFLEALDLEAHDRDTSRVDLANAYVNWVEWITDDRLLISITNYAYRDGRKLTFLQRDQWEAVKDKDIFSFKRYMTSDANGKNLASMFGSAPISGTFAIHGVVSFLDDDPNHILLSAWAQGHLNLYKVDIHTGKSSLVVKGEPRTYAWYVDKTGQPTFRFDTNRRGTYIDILAQTGTAGEVKWTKVREIPLRRDRHEDALLSFEPLYPGPSSMTYYVAARPEGTDTRGIYLYDFKQNQFVKTVKVIDGFDIGSGLFSRESRELIGYVYNEHALKIDFVNADMREIYEKVRARFAPDASVFPLKTSKSGGTWLFHVEASDRRGAYYLYTAASDDLRKLNEIKEALSAKSLGRAEVINYRARDGLALSGYLTRPASWQEGDPAPPLIMMPHGGPEVRDTLEFNYMVQVLVAHGYQVFQPNFRGSSGFGRAFADRGRRQWGRAMQTDIEDALLFLEAEGYVELDRSCIIGASYGGYTALVAATLTPELYQCIIASSGPSDLLNFLKTERKEEGRNSEAYKYWIEHIGDPRRDKDELEAVSPINFAARIVRPLLLIHPREDRIVSYKETERMARALDKAKVEYTLLTLEDSGHSYRSDEDERLEYEAVLAFLAEHLPVAAVRNDASLALAGANATTP